MNRFASVILALSISASAHAATSEFRILLDLDNNLATGCTSNAFNGAEQLIVTSVEMTAPAHVTSVTRSTCSGGSFGTPVMESSGGWAVSIDPTTGQAVLETMISMPSITVPLRIGYAVGSAPATVVTYTGVGERRRSVGRPGSGRPIELDGDPSDWAGISPISTSGSGTLYFLEGKTALFFRFDGRLVAGPRANDDSFAARQGQLTNISAPGVLGNDVEPNGLPMTAAVGNSPTHGSVVMQPDGSFLYSHDGSSSPTDTFTYRASSSAGTSDPANVTMNIILNAPPVAASDAYLVAEGGTLTVAPPGVLGNDSDPDTPASGLTARVVTGPSNGTLTLDLNGGFTYTHNGSETLSDSFTYRVSDGFSFAATVVTITITPVNDAPTAIADGYTTNEDTLLTVVAPGVLGNDSDPDSVGLTAAVVTTTTNGLLTFSPNGSFTYMPNANFFGTDSFTYRANDGVVSSTLAATVTITVTAVNDPPSFTAGPNVTVAEDSAAFSAAWATAISSGPNETEPVTFNVTNDNNALFAVQPAISPTGVLTFTPAPNANGVANVSVSLSDGSLSTIPVIFTITVTAVNDTPSFTAGGNVTVNEDSGAYSAAQAGAINAGPSDEAGQTLTFNVSNDNNTLFSVQPAIASIGTLTFTTAASAFGTATVTVTLSDNGAPPATTAPQTFTITLTSVNDVPSFTSGGNVSTPEDTPFSAAWATAISVGPPNEAGQLVDFIVSNDNNTLFSVQPAVSPTGVLTFTPAADASGTATVTVQIHDNGGTTNGGIDTSAAQTFTITVNAVNDPPTFNQGGNVTVGEDSGPYSAAQVSAISPGPADEAAQSVSFNVTNDNNPLFSIQPAIDPAGVLTFTPAANAFGTATVSVTATDNGAPPATSAALTFTITLTAVNDSPVVATSAGTTAFIEDGPPVAIDAALTVSDIDSPNLVGATVTITNLLDSGSETLAATTVGTITANYVAPTLTLSGNGTLAEYQQVLRSVTYNNTNDTPNTTDRSITFQVNDGAGVNNLSNVASKTVSVAANNDAPVVTTTGGSSTFTEAGGAVVVDDGVTVSDVDSTTLASATVTITNLLNAGLETLAANTGGTSITANYVAPTLTLTGVDSLANYQQVLRSITYENSSTSPNATPRSISFLVNDGTSDSNTATKSVTIVSINSAPVVTTSVGTTPFVEDSSPALVDNAITVTDSDTATLASATVTISNLLDSGAETLAATTVGAITANYVAPTLTLSGVDSLANYQTVLRSVTYNNTSNTPDTTGRTINFQVNDGAAVNNMSNIASKTVTVAAANDAPVVTTTGGTTSFTEAGGAVVVDSGVTVTDVDNTTLASATVTITNLLNAGLETLAANTGGTLITASYVAPTLTLSGVDTVANYQQVLRSVTYDNTSTSPNITNRAIAFQVNDGAANSNIANKDVSITPVNSAPVVMTNAGTTAFIEDGPPPVVDPLINVVDSDNGTLASVTVTISNLLDTGFEFLTADTTGTSITANYTAPTLTLTGVDTLANYDTVLRSVTYNNTSNAPNTTDRIIEFRANDGEPVNNLSAIATRTVSVTPSNDAPTVTTSAGVSTFTEGGGPVLVDSSITVIDPDSAMLASATVTITLTFNPGQEFLAATTGGTAITANYVDPTLTLTGVDSIANYQTVLRSVTYLNASNAPDTTQRLISFTANDGALNSNTATKAVNVVSVNSAPVVTTTGGTTAFVEDGGPVAVDNGLTVTDSDNTTLASATVTITNLLDTGFEVLAANFLGASITANYVAPTLTLTGLDTVANYELALRSVTYNNTSNTPNTGTNRTISFQVNDGTDPSSNAIKVLTVAAANDAPTVTTSGGATNFTEDGGPVAVDAGVTVTDPDSANLTQATVTITNLLDAGLETLAAPTLVGGITANYVAPTLTLSGSATPADYQTVLRAVTYENTSQNPTTTTRVIAFDASDGTATSTAANKSVTITTVNDAPVVTTSVGTTAFTEDGGAVAVDGGVTVTDIDSANLTAATITITNLLDAGMETLTAPTLLGGATASYVAPTLTISGSATVTQYQTMLQAVTYNNASQNPNTTVRVVSFQVDDGGGVNNLSNTANKSVSVTAVNDAPTATAKSHATHSAIRLTIDAATHTGELKEGATDPEDAFNELTVDPTVINVNPATATVVVTDTATGSFTFETPGGFSGAATFQFRVCDDNVGDPNQCGPYQTVTFNVTGPELWFIDSTPAVVCGGTCNGSNSKPFPDLTSLPIVATRGTGDRIFVANGSYTGHTFAASEHLIGEGSSGTTSALLGVVTPSNGTLDTLPAVGGTAPTLQGTVTAANNSLLRGVAINVTGGTIGYLASGATVNVLESSVTSQNRAVDMSNSSAGASGVNFTSTTSTGGTAGILLSNVFPGTLNFGSGTLSGHSSAAIRLNSIGNTTISYAGNVTATVRAVHIGTNGLAGTGLINAAANVTISGQLNGGGVAVYESTGGTLNITNSTKTFNTGTTNAVELINNDNTNLNFTGGGLVITTTTGKGFTATAGGIVQVLGGGNTISSGGGIALEIQNTTIGVSDLTFQSISANGGSNGILLNNTGTAGGLTVTGTGAADTGGTIQNTTGDGITLNTTRDVSLTDLQISNSGDNAVDATSVINLTLDSVDIATTANMGILGATVTDFRFQNGSTMTGAGNGANESGIEITDLLGANNAITNSSVTGSQTQNVRITNNVATAGTLTISGSTFSNTSVANGSDAVSIIGNTSANLTVNLTGGNNLNNTQGDGIQVSANNSANVTATINGATSNYNGNLGSAVNIAAADSATITATVSGFTGVSTGTSSPNGLNVINIQNFNTSTINATVQNNTITGLDNNASGIRVIQEANGTINVNINNNNISGLVANGIVAQARAGTGQLNMTLGPSNTINLASALALDGVSIESGSSAGGDTNTVCLNMFNNSSAAAAQQGYRLRQRAGTTFNLQNFAGNGAVAADITTWVNTTKSNTGTTDIVIGTAFSNAPSPCPTP